MLRSALLALVIATSLAPASPARAAPARLAFVQDDGTLKVGGRIVRLFGIHIPPTNRVCRSFTNPVHCAARAVLALDLRVDRFVRCEPLGRNRDRSVTALCRIRDRAAPEGLRYPFSHAARAARLTPSVSARSS